MTSRNRHGHGQPLARSGRVASPGGDGRSHLSQGVAPSRRRRGPRAHSAPRPAGDGLCGAGGPAGGHRALRDRRSARRLRALRAVADPRSRPGLGSRAPRRRCRDPGRGGRPIRAGRSSRGSSLSSSVGSCWSGRLPGSASSPISSRSRCGSDTSRDRSDRDRFPATAPPRCPGPERAVRRQRRGFRRAPRQDRPGHRSARDRLSRGRPRPVAGCAACAGHPVRRRRVQRSWSPSSTSTSPSSDPFLGDSRHRRSRLLRSTISVGWR